MSSTNKCKTQEVLESAQADVRNAEWPGLLGKVAGPVRDVVVSPTLSVANMVIPPVTSRIPFLDNVSAMMLGTTFRVARIGYMVLPHVPSLRDHAHEELRDATANAREAVVAQEEETADIPIATNIFAIPGAVVSLASAGVGYTINATLDLVTSPEEKHQEWERTTDAFIGYLKQYGIDEEVKSLLNPRTSMNMLIMSRIQHDLNSTRDRRQQTALRNVTPPRDLPKLASRFIKYSIAAYGIYMMESSEEARKLVPSLPQDQHTTGSRFVVHGTDMDDIMDAKIGRIARFLNIDKGDIKHVTEPGGDLKLLGHFVAVDHETKSVVLAIRGTHNTSEWITDFDATAVPFCGGVAHKGMAERALNLWENRDTRNAIARALYANPGYRFIVTGQSLGAGVANLVHIKSHHPGENLFQGIKTVCFAYGGPPVFAYTRGAAGTAAISEAFASCYNYIHGADVVAHASIDAVRRVISTLEALDEITSVLSPLDRYLLARGVKSPSDAIIQVVKDGSEQLPSKPGADRLKLPGNFIVWFKETSERPLTYNTCYCDPNAVSNLCIFLDIRMCTDHLPVGYELSLEKIAATAAE